MPTPQNGQTHRNNSSALANELFECVWLFCGVGAFRVKVHNPAIIRYARSESSWFELLCTRRGLQEKEIATSKDTIKDLWLI